MSATIQIYFKLNLQKGDRNINQFHRRGWPNLPGRIEAKFSKFQGTEKAAKRIFDVNVKAQFMQDINAISYAWSPTFFQNWEGHASPIIVDITNHFRAEWCNVRLGNWSCGHAHNCVVNTNGLEATNKVIKDELTYHHLMPVMDFLRQALIWLREQSERRSDGPEGFPNLNKVAFARSHTFSTSDWTSANAWRRCPSKQIRFIPLSNVFVAAAPKVRGDLTDARANAYVTKFNDCSWATFD